MLERILLEWLKKYKSHREETTIMLLKSRHLLFAALASLTAVEGVDDILQDHHVRKGRRRELETSSSYQIKSNNNISNADEKPGIHTLNIDPDTEVDPDEEVERIVVKCKSDLDEQNCLETLLSLVPEDSIRIMHYLKKAHAYAVFAKPSVLEDVVEEGFDIHSDLVRVPQYIPESLKLEDEHGRRLQTSRQTTTYGIGLVKAREAWEELNTKGSGVKVCVLDTGLLSSHQDLLRDNLSGVRGWNSDSQGHGTHVTGTIAAADNTRGVVGVAPEAEIFSIRVFNQFGNFFLSDLIAAVEACRDAGADVINMSLGGPGADPDERELFEELYFQDNVLAVAASGNSGGRDFGFPASYNVVVSVAAVNRQGNLANFSTRNSRVDIAGPGRLCFLLGNLVIFTH